MLSSCLCTCSEPIPTLSHYYSFQGWPPGMHTFWACVAAVKVPVGLPGDLQQQRTLTMDYPAHWNELIWALILLEFNLSLQESRHITVLLYHIIQTISNFPREHLETPLHCLEGKAASQEDQGLKRAWLQRKDYEKFWEDSGSILCGLHGLGVLWPHALLATVKMNLTE